MSHDRNDGARPQRRTRTYETDVIYVQEQGRVFAPLANGKMAVPGSIRFRPYLAKRYRVRVTEIEGRNQCPSEPVDTSDLDGREWIRDGVIIDTLVWKKDRRGEGLIAFHPWTGKVCVPAKGQQIQPGPLQCSQMEKGTVVICYRAEPLDGEPVAASPDPNVVQPDNPFRDRRKPQEGKSKGDGRNSGKKAEGDKPKPKRSGRRGGRRKGKGREVKRPDVKAMGPNRSAKAKTLETPEAKAPKASEVQRAKAEPAAEAPAPQAEPERPAPQPVVTYKKPKRTPPTNAEPKSAMEKFRERYGESPAGQPPAKKSSSDADSGKLEEHHTMQAQLLKLVGRNGG